MAERTGGARAHAAVAILILLASSSLPLPRAARADVRRWPPASASRLELLREHARALRPSTLKLSQQQVLAGGKAPDRLAVLVVGCDFSDSLMWGRNLEEFPGWPAQTRTGHVNFGTETFQFASHDSVYFDIQMRKVSDYLTTVSFGHLTLSWQVHVEIVNLARPMSYYGDADSSDVRLVEMAQDILDVIDPIVDFGPFDTLMIIHAGAGRETDILGDSPEQIYSNYLDRRDFEKAAQTGHLAQPSLRTDEGSIEHVLVLPESESQDPVSAAGLDGFFGTRGVYCFEFGLRLGMLNLADFTPSSRPDSQGIGNFGLMGYGLFAGVGIVPAAPCAMNRMLMGWVDPVEVTGPGDLRLGAVSDAGRAVADTLLVKIPIDNREYFLLEYRLQDPNGDLFYTFEDLNGDLVPDFYDADSDSGDGFPTSSFDPREDQWESTLGSEWDFFVTENPERSDDRCQRGGGSGLNIWHVDERVIEDAVREGTNTINADPRRKGVDFEEADGIQDLDSSMPTAYFLGWDGDVWRGEGASRFGPDTDPPSVTADGLPTGIVVDGISTVVADSLSRDGEGNCTGFVYRPALTFSVAFEPPAAPAPPLAAQLRLADSPGHSDVHVVDLGTSPTNPALDGRAEIVQAGDAGRVYAFRGDLSEWIDGDSDPSTPGVLAVAGPPATPPQWLGPPAVGDVDGDDVPDVILTAPSDVYGFSSADGSGLGNADGLLWHLDPGSGEEENRFVGSPLLLGRDAVTEDAVDQPPFAVWQVVQRFDEAGAVVEVGRVGLEPDVSSSVPLAEGRAVGRPVLAGSPAGPCLAIPWRDEESAGMIFVLTADPTRGAGVRVEGGIAPLPLLAYDFLPEGMAVAWIDTTGAPRAVAVPDLAGTLAPPSAWPFAPSIVGSSRSGPWSSLVGGPIREGGPPVLVRAWGPALDCLDRGMAPMDGFPYSPRFLGTLRGAPSQPGGILVDLDDDGAVDVIWHDPVGRLHAVSLDGASLPGWPLPGPAEPAGSPAVADLDGDGDLELVASGLFAALLEIDAPQQSVMTRRQGELRVYDLPVADGVHVPWSQAGGDARNTGRQPAVSSRAGIASEGSILDPATLLVQPNPATTDRIHVRVRLRRTANVMLTLYNLEGEVVARVGPIDALGGATMDQTISIAGLASGYYLCRLAAEDEHQVLPFTVVR